MSKTNGAGFFPSGKNIFKVTKKDLSHNDSTFALALFFQVRTGFDTLIEELGRVPSNSLLASMCLFDDL